MHHEPKTTSPSLTLSQAASQLDLTAREVESLCASGALPGFRENADGPLRVLSDELAAFVAQNARVIAL